MYIKKYVHTDTSCYASIYNNNNNKRDKKESKKNII